MAEETRTFSPDDRFYEAVAAFEEARDAGSNPTSTEWLIRYPDVADRLRAYFADARNLRGLAGPIAVAATLLPDIPDYEMIESVASGIGGMGVVFKARKKSTQQIVALKVIRPDLLENLAPDECRKAVERFVTEARVAALLEHENIVKVYDVGEVAGRPYYAMRYVEGKSLSGVIQDRIVPPEQAAVYIEQVARAVHVAHQHGVIHRDLKPNNILIESSSDKPLVADFGLAKLLERDQEMTRTGDIMGAPPYMSPEQALNSAHVTTATDVYGLGATLYALLTGRPPFLGDTAVATLKKVLEEEPTKPRKLNPAVPRDLETICLKCLKKEPGKRYASSAELADDLQCFREGLPIIARPTGPVERVWRWCRRNRRVAILLVCVAISLLGGTAFSTYFGIEANRLAGISKDNEEKAKASAKKATESEEMAKASAKKAMENEEMAKASAKKAMESEEKAKESEKKTKELAIESDERREQAETWALYVQFEHYVSQAPQHPNLALVGAASLLPKAARLKDQSLADLLRWQTGAWKGSATRLKAPWTSSTEIGHVAISADGKTALSMSPHKSAGLWEVATGKRIGPPLQHKSSGSSGFVAIALSGNGKVALTGDLDKTARLWDTATGKPIGPPLQHQYWVRAVALNADGTIALTGSGGEGRLWDTATAKPIGRALDLVYIDEVALSADGKIALVRSIETVQTWETATGKPAGPALRLKLTMTDLSNPAVLGKVALSADGNTVLTGGVDGTAQLWERATGKPIGPPVHHQPYVHWVALSADGKTALATWFKTTRLWETATGKPIGSPLDHHTWIGTAVLSPDGKTALTQSEKSLRLWETAPGTPFGPPYHHQALSSVALSSDGKFGLAVHADKTVRLWELSTGNSIGPVLEHPGPVGSVALSTDGKTALTTSYSPGFFGPIGSAWLWETATGKRIGSLSGENIFAIALSANGKTAMTTGHILDMTARLWDTATGNPIGPPLQHPSCVVSVALSADGTIAMTGCKDKIARLWDTATGKPIGFPLDHQAWVTFVALSSDGKTAMTGTDSRYARFEHSEDQVRLKVTGKPNRQNAETAMPKVAVRLWETATGKPLKTLRLRRDNVITMKLSADGKLALTESDDGSTHLWDAATGDPIDVPRLREIGKGAGLALSADFKTAVTIFEKTARPWKIPQPIRGDPERIMLWTQVITGLEVDERTAVRALDAATWQQRRQRLEELGGPPME